MPTIGHIYQGLPKDRPCVVYFNGLGLPLDTSPHLLNSDRHWFNRVWTLQETLQAWLPGGLTGYPLINGRDFFRRLRGLVQTTSFTDKRAELVQDLTHRYRTKKLDRISGLAYSLGCPTLPVYDEGLSVESAWALLIEHMQEMERFHKFLIYAVDSPFKLWPSWSRFVTFTPSPRPSVDPFSLSSDLTKSPATGARRYTPHGKIIGPCRILREPCKDAVDGNDVRFGTVLRLVEGQDPICIRPFAIHGMFPRDIDYLLVSTSDSYRDAQYWIVIEVVEERGNSWLEVEAIKWGVIGVSRDNKEVTEKLLTVRAYHAKVTWMATKRSDEALIRSNT